MSRLIILSNRVSLPGKTDTGGLAVALREALKPRGGVWCGWSGNISEQPERHLVQDGNTDYLTLDFSQKDYHDFYVGFCNSQLWPVFHYRLDLAHFDAEMFEGYQRVNAMFAKRVNTVAQPGDVIWVHDYQLITAGAHMRRLGMQHRIGFFLHIPFPVPELWMALPNRDELLEGLCAYDEIGFQTDKDLQAFLRCVKELAGGRVKRNADNTYDVQVFGRKCMAGSFPISIDTEDMVRTAAVAQHSLQTAKLQESMRGRSLVIGVDRLDYSKGLPQRLAGYQAFLRAHPEHAGKVTYAQITPTSRTDVGDYGKIREEVEELAAHINGEHADIDWVPIRYLNKSFSRDALAGFYRMARVGLVTPLRDGMNLVAKEYVAAQNPNDPGVLVLSQFAGAVHELDAALIVNPFDTREMAEAIQAALIMPLDERRERHQAMMAVLHGNDIYHWTDAFLNALTQAHDEKTLLPQHSYPALRAAEAVVAM